jgi:hypothetical protein
MAGLARFAQGLLTVGAASTGPGDATKQRAPILAVHGYRVAWERAHDLTAGHDAVSVR